MTKTRLLHNFAGENIIRYDTTSQAAYPPMGKDFRSHRAHSPSDPSHQAPYRPRLSSPLMPMTPAIRKLVLFTHVTASVAWIGAVATFLVLSITGLNSTHPQIVRASYLVMPSITWYIIVPLAFAALATGIVLSLGTQWGLFRYYWVLAKLLINSLSVPILLLHTQVIHEVSSAAAKTNLSFADLHDQRVQLVTIAVAALLALLAATILSVYKPRGITPRGQRLKGEKAFSLSLLKWYY